MFSLLWVINVIWTISFVDISLKKERREHHLLEWTFDGCGCDFKVLVSPSIHPLVGGDSQGSDLCETQTNRSTDIQKDHIYFLIIYH